MGARKKCKPSSQQASSFVVGLATIVATTMIAQQIASKAIRDGYFLDQFDVTLLPVAVIAASIASFASAFVFGRFISKVSPFAAVPILFAVHGALFLAESALAAAAPRVVASLLYLHTAAFGGAVVSGFWSVINERFDPYTARQVMGKIAGGATFGGLLGGALTWFFSQLQVPTLLAGLGAANWICGLVTLMMIRTSLNEPATSGQEPRVAKDRSDVPAPVRLFDGISVLLKDAYPRNIGLLVLFGAATTSLVDYAFKADVSADSESLVGFFAMFYTATGVLTFLVQTFATHRVLKRAGVVSTVAAFPIVIGVGLFVAVLFPSLVVLVAVRGAMMVVENSFYRSGYELLYTAVPKRQKRSAKILIDLGADRIGTAIGSGMALALVAIAAASVNRLLLGIALTVALALLAVLFRLRAEYLTSLAHRIRRSTNSVPPPDPSAGGTRALANTFVDGSFAYPSSDTPSSSTTPGHEATTPDLSHEELMAMVFVRAEAKKSKATSSYSSVSSSSSSVRLSSSSVRSPSSEAEPVSLLATPLAQLLRSPSVDDKRWMALCRQAPQVVGQLSDVLLSARETIVTRIRSAELLATVPAHRVVSALVEALSSDEFRVRRSAAIALVRIVRQRPSLAPNKRLLSELAIAELRRPARTQEEDTAYELTSSFRSDARGQQLAPSLELVFLLLSIAGDEAALRLALDAITSSDAAERGTGLEYLDNLLPANVRSQILGLVEHPERTRASHHWPADTIASIAARIRMKKIGVSQARQEYRRFRQAEYSRADKALEL